MAGERKGIRTSSRLPISILRQYSNISFFQTGGVIVWQLNDCWPVTSWSIVDYFVSAVTTLPGVN